jgi:hypothetical protein
MPEISMRHITNAGKLRIRQLHACFTPFAKIIMHSMIDSPPIKGDARPRAADPLKVVRTRPEKTLYVRIVRTVVRLKEHTAKACKACKLLAAGTGINKVARSVGLSNGTVARVKAEMAA